MFTTAGDRSGRKRFGSAAEVLINEIITSGSQPSVTFPSIDNIWRDLKVVVRGRGTDASVAVAIRIRFNSDSGNNYHYAEFYEFGTATNFTQSVNQSFIHGGFLPGSTATASYSGNSQTLVSDYRGNTFFHSTSSEWSCIIGSAVGNVGTGKNSGQWNSASIINHINVSLSAGNFVDNSVVSLYGIF